MTRTKVLLKAMSCNSPTLQYMKKFCNLCMFFFNSNLSDFFRLIMLTILVQNNVSVFA